MGFKKLPFSDQLSYGGVHTKRKVFSSFGLGLGTSLIILSLIFLYCPVNVSLFNFNPIFQTSSSSLPSWPFSYSSTSSSSSSLELQKNKEEKVEAKTDQRNILNGSRNANISQFEGTPQKGNFSVGVENARIQKSHDGESSENGKNGTLFSGEEPHEENISERSKNSSFLDFNGGERSHEGNSSKKEKIDGLGSEGVANEKTQLGSSDIDGKNSSFYGNANQINDEKSPKKKPTEIEKIEDSLGKEKRVSKKTDEEIQKGNFSENSKVLNAYNGDGDLKDLPDLSEKCNIFEGKWVRDERKPYYPAGSCPHIDRDFDCHLNGRPDDDFLRWRWQPNDCNIPSFNATDFLERLRGKRLIFVGDSLNRNMWESLVCMLRHGVADKKRVHEVSGRSEFKVRGCYAFRYEDYNCSVDFVSAPFLVRENIFNGQNGSVETLRLDKMDMTTSSYRTADVIVFNTGHWWTHEKTSKGENYYQEGTHVYPKLEVIDAFKKAMITWGRWIDKKIDPKRTQVLFRGYSPTHFSGGQWNSGGQCHKETDPIFNNTYLAEYPPKMKVIEDVIKQMKIPVQYLNISKLTDYRKDGHPSIYRKEYKTEKEWAEAVQSQDCSHWCLPGVPDTWNELLYASLLQSGEGSWKY